MFNMRTYLKGLLRKGMCNNLVEGYGFWLMKILVILLKWKY